MREKRGMWIFVLYDFTPGWGNITLILNSYVVERVSILSLHPVNTINFEEFQFIIFKTCIEISFNFTRPLQIFSKKLSGSKWIEMDKNREKWAEMGRIILFRKY